MAACPDEETWIALLDDASRRGVELDAHLSECSACRDLVAALTSNETSIAAPDEAGARARSDVRCGDLIAGKWKLEELLGTGGMGRVFRARHTNGHAVAIKFLHPSLTSDPDVVRRFRREGYLANRIEHPAAVRVLDDGDHDGPFLVMELLEGSSCRGELRRGGPMDRERALDIVFEVARAVAEAHRIGVVHRDLKPDNVFLDRDGRVRLLDFGLASVRSTLGQDSLTADGVTLGTAGYMAPEQARGLNTSVDRRADVWSLAATAITLMTGRTVHGGETPAEQLAFAVTKTAAPAQALVRELSSPVARVLDRALSFDPSRRQPDAGAFADELARARTRPVRSRRPLLATLGVISVACAVGGVVHLRATRSSSDPVRARAPMSSVGETTPTSVLEHVEPASTAQLQPIASGSASAPAPARTRALARNPAPSVGARSVEAPVTSASSVVAPPAPSRDPLVPRL